MSTQAEHTQDICRALQKLEPRSNGDSLKIHRRDMVLAHQPDECISIDGMLKALELTMLMLLVCDKEDIK